MGVLSVIPPLPRGLAPPIPRRAYAHPFPEPPPRLPVDDIPPGAADDLPDGFRDTRPPVDTGPRRITEEVLPDRWRGEQDDVNLPWYRNPTNLVPAAMTAGIGGLAWLLGKGLSDTGGAEKLAEDQRPLPGGPDLNDPALRRGLMRSTEGRAALGSPDAQRYLDRKNAAENAWRAKAFLAGGSQNLNSGNSGLYNQFLSLGPQDAQGLPGIDYELSDAQRAILQQNMPINPYRAKIEAAQLDQAAELAGKMVAKQLENSVPDPVKAEAVRQQRQATQMDVYNKARKHIQDNYAGGWLWSDFTDVEQASAIDDLQTIFGLSPEEAADFVRSFVNSY